jgi:hypothetical protein
MTSTVKKTKYKKGNKFVKVKSQTIPKDRSKYLYGGILVLTVLFIALIRIRLLQVPLERDEGEFAYMGQLILQGIPPYLISYNMKLPGIYAAYALMMSIFGQSVEGVHLGFLVINAATIIMVFLLTKRLYDAYAGVIASASFAILSVSPSVLGTSAHATHFVLLPATGGIFLMLKGVDSGKLQYLFWSGICLGLSFLMKQPGAFFVIFTFLYFLFIFLRRSNTSFPLFVKSSFLFLCGAIIPFVFTCLVLYRSGVYGKFWFWTFSYAYEYGTKISLSRGTDIFFGNVLSAIGMFYFLWGIAGVGISALFWDKTARAHAAFVLGFFVFSFLAVCPGLYFRHHYFVLILPAIGLLAGIGISSLKRLVIKWGTEFKLIPIILFLVVFSLGIIQYRSFFFELTPAQASRDLYGANPFPESIEIAKYIETHSKNEDKILVLGSEPQIYFYSKRHSATGYIYTYPLMEDQQYALKMQKEMIGEIEKAQPEYIIFINIPTSWLIEPKSEKTIFNWAKEYTKKFNLVGIIDILSKIQTVYRWDKETINYSPRSPYFIYVYKRKTIGND